VRFPFTAAGLQAQLQVPGGTTGVLVQADDAASRMVGFGQFWLGPGGTVHLGRLLCQSLMQQATLSTGARAVTLRVYRDNVAAFALYSHLGFVPVAAESNDAVLFMRAEASGGSA
jgi:RimJ/RimL family protein N-acetyltransferase